MKKMKEIFNKSKPIIIILLSIFVTFSINMNWDKDVEIRYSYTGNRKNINFINCFSSCILCFNLLATKGSIRKKE